MIGRFVITVLVCCALFSGHYPAAAQEEIITLVYNTGVAPLKFTSEDGQPTGLLNDYWHLLADKADIAIEFVEVPSFAESLAMVKNGEADLHGGLFLTEERSAFLAFSHPVLDVNYSIYSSPDLPPFTSLNQTQGYVVGVVQGGYTETYIKKEIPQSHLVIFDDVNTLLDAVMAGEIKVFVASDIHLNYYLASRDLANPFNHDTIPLYEQTYYGATARGQEDLIRTIKDAQDLLTASDLKTLRDKWLVPKREAVTQPAMTTLTPEELAWIKTHPVIRVSNEMDWPPFDFNEGGRPVGLSIDIANLIAERTGLRFDYRSNRTWQELEQMLQDKELDILHSLTYSGQRAEHMLFTKPYATNQAVLITADTTTDIRTIDDLPGKTIAVVRGYNQQQLLAKLVADGNFLFVASPLEALKAVSSGRADATVRFNGVASYLINQHLLTNLKFVDEFRLDDASLHELAFAVRNDWPILRDILQKGLDSISRQEMDDLRRKWISLGDSSPPPPLLLTAEERQWLKSHPSIILGSDYRWPPFDFTDSSGRHSGLAADYLHLIAERTGLEITIRSGVWADILGAMQAGELDGLACAVKTDERESYLNFTTPYLQVPAVIVVKTDNRTISDLHHLAGKTVSINKGSYMHDWMATRYPQINLHLSTSNEASLEAVSYGEADAYIGNLAVTNYIIRERMLTNLKIVRRLGSIMTETAVAIDNRQPLLFSIMQKALNSISEQERHEILNRWYTAAAPDRIILSPQERVWLQSHPVIRLTGPPDWAPVSAIDKKGKYFGIVTEYLDKLSQKSGLKFQTVPTATWSTALQMISGQQVEFISAISISEERQGFVDFTDSYMQAEAVLITRDDVQFLRGIEHIDTQRLGSIRDFVVTDQLRRDYPALPLQLYDTPALGLKALSRGDIDVFVLDIPTFEYTARKLSLANLKISGITPYTFEIAFGVAKGNPELVSILNKGLSMMSQQEKHEIYNAWVTLQEPLIDYSLIWKILAAAGAFLLMMFYWNRRMASEVAMRKEAEAIARQASRAKSDFLANMSHEIRTPMNSVLGFAELLDNMITDPEQKSYLKSIRTGGRALLEIINDILDLSKIEAGKMQLKTEPFSLAGLFTEMEDFFTLRMARKNLLFTATIAESFPPYIEMDPIRLRQVLINLIGNAVKFTEHGAINLECRDVQRSQQGDRVGFTLAVRDTGIGIPPEQQQAIFNKFEQQEGLDHSRYGGTGLGLAICQSLVSLMDGTISLKSSPGEGAEFRIAFTHIPVVREPRREELADVERISRFKPANVLIADDVADNPPLVVGYFKGSDIHFHEAANGKEALRLMSRVDIDLVLMDLRMPEMSGYEAITAIRQDEALQHVPVIAFTASVMGEDMEKVHQYGFNDYLRKPVSRPEMLRTAARFLPMAEHQAPPRETATFPENIPAGKLHEFLDAAEHELLPEWERVKDKGDFDLIGQFARNLSGHATACAIDSMADFGGRLEEYAQSFDILEVDAMMSQFPELIFSIQHQLEPGKEHHEEKI